MLAIWIITIAAVVLVLNTVLMLVLQHHQLQKHSAATDKSLSQTVEHQFTRLQTTLRECFVHQNKFLDDNIEKINRTASEKLQQIGDKVDKNLVDTLEKTNSTFSNILQRLTLIDQAQQQLVQLSDKVTNLQQILADKRSRGAFGEVQLKNLIQNLLPSSNYAFQHTLSNNSRCDCILFLPAPTGNIVIDAKFPLENFKRMVDAEASAADKKMALGQFKQDIKKHVDDIANKYILTNETADGAIMFIPAEAVFAEIHSSCHSLVDIAHQKRVWLASPTTMMAILTTASSVLKDSETRKHVHVIQAHLRALAKDFSRLDLRMDKLSKHISMAQDDVEQVQTSTKKISQRFKKIDKVNIDTESLTPEPILTDDSLCE